MTFLRNGMIKTNFTISVWLLKYFKVTLKTESSSKCPSCLETGPLVCPLPQWYKLQLGFLRLSSNALSLEYCIYYCWRSKQIANYLTLTLTLSKTLIRDCKSKKASGKMGVSSGDVKKSWQIETGIKIMKGCERIVSMSQRPIHCANCFEQPLDFGKQSIDIIGLLKIPTIRNEFIYRTAEVMTNEDACCLLIDH